MMYEIDWDSWTPVEKAVLCFIKDNNRIMLIHKKTGLGTGKISAPGGRIEHDETPEQAAIRELIEEVGLTAAKLENVAELSFEFTDGYSLHVNVFFAYKFSGTPIETEEAKPFWCDIDSIPYDKMWQDDIYWLPNILSGEYIKGRFIFDGDKMLKKKIFNLGQRKVFVRK